jgi:hypothetical protein
MCETLGSLPSTTKNATRTLKNRDLNVQAIGGNEVYEARSTVNDHKSTQKASEFLHSVDLQAKRD